MLGKIVRISNLFLEKNDYWPTRKNKRCNLDRNVKFTCKVKKYLEAIMPMKYLKSVKYIRYKCMIMPRKWNHWSEYKTWFVAHGFLLVMRNVYL